jgi:predicted benzoate:H+ symporter BenE
MTDARKEVRPEVGRAAPRWGWRSASSELAGACGDLGTFIPHVIGAITIAGLAPAGILVGFGAFFIASGLFYGLPMAVQPMKAVSAVLVTGQVGPGEVAAAGLLIGATLLVLGATGTIGWLARVIPQSVSTGLQLGLGIAMGALGIELMLRTPWLGLIALALLVSLMLVPRFPAAPAMLVVAVAIGDLAGEVQLPLALSPA